MPPRGGHDKSKGARGCPIPRDVIEVKREFNQRCDAEDGCHGRSPFARGVGGSVTKWPRPLWYAHLTSYVHTKAGKWPRPLAKPNATLVRQVLAQTSHASGKPAQSADPPQRPPFPPPLRHRAGCTDWRKWLPTPDYVPAPVGRAGHW